MIRRSLALAIATLAVAPAAATETGLRTLTVTGEGEARAAPDQASADFAVSIRDDSAETAVADAAAAMGRVLAALDAAGVAAADVQTTEIALAAVQRYDEGERRPIPDGYQARHAVRVMVRDLARLGSVIDAAVAAGATETGGVRFALADPAAAHDAARRAAVAEAARAAAVLADAAGVALGAPLSIDLGGAFAQPAPRMMQAAAADAAMPVAPGELTFRATVTVTYAME